MEKISDYISKLKENESGIKRIYRDYSIKVARNYWMQLTRARVRGDVEVRKYWNELLFWVMADSRSNLELSKGIGLIGSTGIGKTTAMQVVNDIAKYDQAKYWKGSKLIPLRFHVFNAREIVADYENRGFDGLQKYYRYANIMIDDLGTEQATAKHYGTTLNVIEDVIERRYECRNKMTHFTSNLNMQDIREKYSDRVYSRLNEMANIIETSGRDFRLS